MSTAREPKDVRIQRINKYEKGILDNGFICYLSNYLKNSKVVKQH